MRPKILFPVALFCITAYVTQAGIGPIPGAQPIATLFRQADLVCRCSVVTVQTISERDISVGAKHNVRYTKRAVLRNDKTYKAGQTANQFLSVVFETDKLVSSAQLALSDGMPNLLLFLKSAGADYVFVDTHYSILKVPPTSLVTNGSGLEQLEADVVNGMRKADRNSILDGLLLLGGFDNLSLTSVSYVRQLSRSDDPELALSTYAVLLKSDDPEEVAAFASFHRKNPYGDRWVLTAIASALRRLRNPKALGSLETLLASPNADIRLGALDAVRSMGGASSVPALIKLLDDENSTIRYVAVITLCEITGKQGCPGMGPFERDEQRYIAEWKNWWRQEGHGSYEIQRQN